MALAGARRELAANEESVDGTDRRHAYLTGMIAGLEVGRDCLYIAAGVETGKHFNPRIIVVSSGEHKVEVEWRR